MSHAATQTAPKRTTREEATQTEPDPDRQQFQASAVAEPVAASPAATGARRPCTDGAGPDKPGPRYRRCFNCGAVTQEGYVPFAARRPLQSLRVPGGHCSGLPDPRGEMEGTGTIRTAPQEECPATHRVGVTHTPSPGVEEVAPLRGAVKRSRTEATAISVTSALWAFE